MNKEKMQLWPMVRIALVLFAISAVVALMLSVVNEITAPKIAEQNAQAFAAAMQNVLPAEDYQPIALEDYELDPVVTEVYTAEQDGAIVGYCVKASPAGFGGAIELVVGVEAGGKVSKVNIVSVGSETAGVGTKTQNEEWLDQFREKTSGLELKTNGSAEGNQVNAVTGATVSSRAVTGGVQAALSAVEIIEEAAQIG